MTTTICTALFLSTLSLRRATQTAYFFLAGGIISIHALLAESDGIGLVFMWWGVRFLSTLSLRRATRLGLLGWLRTLISIHALLAESDHSRRSRKQRHPNFYPRSPCGERRVNEIPYQREIDQFLSTLSLRRATCFARCRFWA